MHQRTRRKEHLRQRPAGPPHVMMKLGQQVRAGTKMDQHDVFCNWNTVTFLRINCVHVLPWFTAGLCVCCRCRGQVASSACGSCVSVAASRVSQHGSVDAMMCLGLVQRLAARIRERSRRQARAGLNLRHQQTLLLSRIQLLLLLLLLLWVRRLWGIPSGRITYSARVWAPRVLRRRGLRPQGV